MHLMFNKLKENSIIDLDMVWLFSKIPEQDILVVSGDQAGDEEPSGIWIVQCHIIKHRINERRIK